MNICYIGFCSELGRVALRFDINCFTRCFIFFTAFIHILKELLFNNVHGVLCRA